MPAPGSVPRPGTFGGRLVGALRLDPETYEDVEHDPGALWQALAVTLLSSLAIGVGATGIGAVATLGAGTVVTLAGWLLSSSLIFVIGTRLLPEPQTEASVGQVMRTTGFAAAPGLFGLVGLAGPAGPWLLFGVTLWTLAALLVAVRQALDFTSLWRALGVVAIGWVAYLTLVGLAAAFARP